MSAESLLVARRPSGLESEAEFTSWVRQIVKGAAELQAFETGQIDAIMDADSGSAVLSPGARTALQGSNRLIPATLDALPLQVCVLDSAGTVIMTNGAWSAFVGERTGAGLGVREGANFLTACRATVSIERVHAAAVANGFRQVLAGERQLYRRNYVFSAPSGHCAFTLTIAPLAADGVMHVLVTRDNVRKLQSADGPFGSGRTKAYRGTAIARPDTPNRMLAALPDKEYEQLRAGLEPVRLTYGQVLYEPGQPIRYVYFPGTCPVSLLTLVDDRRSLEVGLVGGEGMVGAPLALGAATSSVRALVQGTGTGVRMKASLFLKEFQRSPALQQALLSFIEILMYQVTQNAACNHFHGIQERLARWLLMMRERVPSSSFYLTHEYLAGMLGTRRESVTAAAHALKRRNLIKYSRGNITILDQRGLKAASCSCYRPIKTAGLIAGP